MSNLTYVNESLSAGEEIKAIFGNHFLVRWYAIILMFTVVLFPMGFWKWLQLRKTEQVLTNKRVIVKRGVVSRTTDEILLKAVESVTYDQSILGRFLNYGTVTISGRGTTHVKLHWMEDPLQVKRLIEGAIQ